MIFNKSFTDELASIKSTFQLAHDKTASLIEKMSAEVSSKKDSIKELENEIRDIEDTKEQANKFVTSLKGILA